MKNTKSEIKKEFKELSETEKEIMEFLWSCQEKDEILSFAEILDYFNTEKNRNWKKQTLSTYLLKLSEQELIIGTKKGRTVLYSPITTPKKYEKSKAKGLLDRMYEGSVSKFMSALYDGEKMPEDDINELKKWLEDK